MKIKYDIANVVGGIVSGYCMSMPQESTLAIPAIVTLYLGGLSTFAGLENMLNPRS
jgi:hypothetical protein